MKTNKTLIIFAITLLLSIFSVSAVNTFQFQENPNSFSTTGGWYPDNTGAVFYDGDYDTNSFSDGSSPFLFFNYTMPSNTISAVWTEKLGSNDLDLRNISVLNNCFINNQVSIRVQILNTGRNGIVTCYNGTDYQFMHDNDLDQTQEANPRFYEEAITWEITPPLVLPTINSCSAVNSLVGCNANAVWNCDLLNANSSNFQVNSINFTATQINSTLWRYTRTHTDTSTINQTLTLTSVSATNNDGTSVSVQSVAIQHDCVITPTNTTGYNNQFETSDTSKAIFDLIVGIFVGLATLGVLLGVGVALSMVAKHLNFRIKK